MTTTAAFIAAGLEQDIRSGCLPPGARLPTHRDLAYRHGCALNTASHAMRLLAAHGLRRMSVVRCRWWHVPCGTRNAAHSRKGCRC